MRFSGLGFRLRFSGLGFRLRLSGLGLKLSWFLSQHHFLWHCERRPDVAMTRPRPNL